jgi:hypothetical protein
MQGITIVGLKIHCVLFASLGRYPDLPIGMSSVQHLNGRVVELLVKRRTQLLTWVTIVRIAACAKPGSDC